MYAYYQPDGYRQLITASCPPDMTRQRLEELFLVHSEKLKYLPGLTWYTLCFTFNTIDYSDGSPGEPLQFDAYEELYFSSLEDLKTAYRSSIMQDELNNLAQNGLSEQGILNGVWAEANIIKMKGLSSPPEQRGCARIFGGCKCTKEMSRKDLKDWYYGHAERVLDEEGRMIIPEIIGYIHNFTIDDSPFGKPFVDAYCNNWWATKEDMFKTFNGDIWKGQLVHREDHIDVHDKTLFIGALAMEHIVDIPIS
jgi:hypothetical protein